MIKNMSDPEFLAPLLACAAVGPQCLFSDASLTPTSRQLSLKTIVTVSIKSIFYIYND